MSSRGDSVGCRVRDDRESADHRALGHVVERTSRGVASLSGEDAEQVPVVGSEIGRRVALRGRLRDQRSEGGSGARRPSPASRDRPSCRGCSRTSARRRALRFRPSPRARTRFGRPPSPQHLDGVELVAADPSCQHLFAGRAWERAARGRVALLLRCIYNQATRAMQMPARRARTEATWQRCSLIEQSGPGFSRVLQELMQYWTRPHRRNRALAEVAEGFSILLLPPSRKALEPPPAQGFFSSEAGVLGESATRSP